MNNSHRCTEKITDVEWITDSNVVPTIIKLLEEKLHNIAMGIQFLGFDPNSSDNKTKNRQTSQLKICKEKEAINRVKREPIHWGK